MNWIVDHENDLQFDKMPLVCIHLHIFSSPIETLMKRCLVQVEFNIEIESPNPSDDATQARENEIRLVSHSNIND